MRSVYLMGPPGCGKTAVGLALSKRLALPFVDTDREIEREARATIASLFRREGETGFRARERRVMISLLERATPCVVAVGGGALVPTDLRHAALRRTWVLSLAAATPTLFARIGTRGAGRPLLAGDVAARLEVLVASRADAYAEAHGVIDAERPIAEMVEQCVRVTRALARDDVQVVPLGRRTYGIHFGPLDRFGTELRTHAPSSSILVTDRRVAALTRHARARWPVEFADTVTLAPPGERAKTLRSVQRMWDAALAARIDRDAMLVGVGGGVVMDLTGFAAATLLRGVRFASAPTTLLAMADASVGGKTGFDHARGKNLLGAFHHPSVVWCDPSLIATQSHHEQLSGLAEIAKIAAVRDPALFERLRHDAHALARFDSAPLRRALGAAIQSKIDVVADDEREHGLRSILNFGHTFGHAIERAAKYRVPHGLCVALGMRAALELGRRLGTTPAVVAADANQLLTDLGLPSRLPRGLSLSAVANFVRTDKKRRGRRLRFVLLTRAGGAVVEAVDEARAMAALGSLREIRARP